MFSSIIKRPLFASLVGLLAYGWLRLVKATTHFVVEPTNLDFLRNEAPIIVTTWHGQQLMVPVVYPGGSRLSALVSRSMDGEIITQVLGRFGIGAIRGSGGTGAKIFKRGGATALKSMLTELNDGGSIALTADVPKVSRVCGRGIVTLAKLSGRPIYPFAVVCKYRVNFRSWDRSSLGLPFGRGAVVYGPPIRVAADADALAIDMACRSVERGIDQILRRAYNIVGSADPGADLAPRTSSE